MPTNGFESSRISEGTMQAGAQHVSNLPRPIFDTPRDPGTKEVLNGHPVLTEQTMAPRILRAADLVGADVHNRAGEQLGKIEDLMIDIPRGHVAYAALSFGGFMGIGDKLFIVPWSALVYDSHANQFLLEIDREALEKAPGFDKDRWPDMAGKGTDFSGGEFAANRCGE